MVELRKRKKDEKVGQKVEPVVDSDSKQELKRPEFAPNVLLKLILFSIMVLTLPIIVFYGTVRHVGTTFAGIYAAVTANLVLIAYVFMAFYEE